MNLNEMFNPLKKTLPIKHTDIPAKVYWALPEHHRKVLNDYIDSGGMGWRAALVTQDKLWDTYHGKTITYIREALTTIGYIPKDVLSGHHDYGELLRRSPTGLLKNHPLKLIQNQLK